VSSAQIDEPPSATKRDLIRRFLIAAGIQKAIDSGRFVETYGWPGGPVFAKTARHGESLRDVANAALETLRAAYAKRRHIWQEEYESHINWEFTEDELAEIVAFLEAPVGQHFLEGRWRMDAYIRTNTEAEVEEIVKEAEASVAAAP
jgi:hypothetical protein